MVGGKGGLLKGSDPILLEKVVAKILWGLCGDCEVTSRNAFRAEGGWLCRGSLGARAGAGVASSGLVGGQAGLKDQCGTRTDLGVRRVVRAS